MSQSTPYVTQSSKLAARWCGKDATSVAVDDAES
jgi:hypothetical protein